MAKPKAHEHFHKDGSLWARGATLDGQMHGPWKFFRKDGVIMRSGAFDKGVQVGEWTTYDKAGKVYKVTKMKAPAAPKTSAAKAKPAAKVAAKPRAKAEPSIDDFMAALDHPLKADIEAVRKIVLGADKAISDGVKWNSVSFRTTEWFATVNLRAKDEVQLVMHLGAKAGKIAPAEAIPDSAGLLKWLGKDRALASLGAGKTLKANLPALKAIVKAWIAFV